MQVTKSKDEIGRPIWSITAEDGWEETFFETLVYALYKGMRQRDWDPDATEDAPFDPYKS